MLNHERPDLLFLVVVQRYDQLILLVLDFHGTSLCEAQFLEPFAFKTYRWNLYFIVTAILEFCMDFKFSDVWHI